MARPRVDDCRLIDIGHHADARGSLTVLERIAELPFDVRRAFVISDVPPGGIRGEHANTLTSELIVCVAGSLSLTVQDEHAVRTLLLSAQAQAVLVPPTLWVELRDFAPGTVVLVLADTEYDEARHGYIREHARWLQWRGMDRVA